MFYKDEARESHTLYADSSDLYTWEVKGEATNDCNQEGPNVFSLDGDVFMIADMRDGMAVYRSDDLTHWVHQPGKFLNGGTSVTPRPMDKNRGHHADVVSFGDRAYMFYFVHSGAGEYMYGENDASEMRRSIVQVAMLKNENGTLKLYRDDPFNFDLSGKQIW